MRPERALIRLVRIVIRSFSRQQAKKQRQEHNQNVNKNK